MNIWDALILGIVEGLTEFLPVSSTGHLILAAKLLGCGESDFAKTFEISIQLGAILSVVVLYGGTLLRNMDVLKRVAAAFLPTAVIGFVLYKLIKKVLMGNDMVVLGAMFLGGVVLIIFDLLHKEAEGAEEDLARMPYTKAVLIGLFQSLAVVPGVSRSAATIIGGLLLGIRRKAIVEFSFLLAVPTILAATAYDLLKTAPSFSGQEAGLLAVGFLTSFLVALISIKSFLSYIQRHRFLVFGVYRMAAALVLWTLLK